MSPQLSVVAESRGAASGRTRTAPAATAARDEWGGSPGVALMWQEWIAAIIARVFDRA